MISQIWSFEYALVPCLVTLFIFDAPILLRRLTRKVYVPIYFAFFPFGYSDELLAGYFGEDEMWSAGGPFRKADKTKVQVKIITVSVASLALTMTFSPFLSALFAHYYLSDHQFTQFLWTIGAFKAMLLCMSLYNLKFEYAITDNVPLYLIAFLYVMYWGALLLFLINYSDWIAVTAASGGLFAIFSGLVEFIFFDIGVELLFFSVVGFLISWWLVQSGFQPIDEQDETIE